MKWFDGGQTLVVWLSLICASCLLKVICKKYVELLDIFAVDPSLLLKSVKVHLDSHLKSLLPHCHKRFCISTHYRIA